MNKWRSKWQKIVVMVIAFFLGGAIFSNLANSQIKPPPPTEANLPALKVHALPEFLAQWQDQSNNSDYFDQIQ